ncbi:hypothetical protein HMPREF9237_00874 [Actinotignum schaalii FB123-CNA-2]|uniref:YlxR domain-containing protein n=2 Tax=Actinotignum schaalii TaxID=59505 RepID=S2VLK8_9ACTO|nr:hypothetical protein HMPREF9237_00874 [Actinotignum schaalii FB123-CNA-2]
MMTKNPRMCVGCRQRAAREELVRLALTDAGVVVDKEQRLPGRGAWVHARPDCLARGMRTGQLAHAFRCAVVLPPHAVTEVISSLA